MLPITQGELDLMIDHAEAQMPDTGVVLRRTTGARGSRGQPAASFVAQAPTRCTFVVNAAREALSESSGAAITDATVYLPQDTVIGPQDRFQLTHRLGRALAAPITYAVIGQPAPDLATLRVGLRAGETSQ